MTPEELRKISSGAAQRKIDEEKEQIDRQAEELARDIIDGAGRSAADAASDGHYEALLLDWESKQPSQRDMVKMAAVARIKKHFEGAGFLFEERDVPDVRTYGRRGLFLRWSLSGQA